MKNLSYVCFWYDHFFRSKGYLFGYKSVILDKSALFHVWGTFLNPNLCCKSKFGSFNCKHVFSMPFSIQEKVKPWVDILIRYFDITNLRGHSSSRSQTEIQGKYRSCHPNRCPGRISSCQHSQRRSRNLLPLPHIAGSWCSKLGLHFHQRIL